MKYFLIVQAQTLPKFFFSWGCNQLYRAIHLKYYSNVMKIQEDVDNRVSRILVAF